jgi:hypothetical protein
LEGDLGTVTVQLKPCDRELSQHKSPSALPGLDNTKGGEAKMPEKTPADIGIKLRACPVAIARCVIFPTSLLLSETWFFTNSSSSITEMF